MHPTFFPQLRPDNPRIALLDGERALSYAELDARSRRCAAGLLAGADDLREERIAFLLPAGFDYVTVMHGVWRAGGIAVPLNTSAATGELEHYLGCAGASRLIVNREHQGDALLDLCARLGVAVSTVAEIGEADDPALPAIDPGRRAMMVFTSGTTSKPKGVVSTHGNIRAQIETLLEAWAWTERDVIPLFLPLHHVHGIINILGCALWAGATVELFPQLHLARIADRVKARAYTVFMAVPTIYVKLIQYVDSLDAAEKAAVCAGFGTMRLNVSGSAACPVPLFEQWRTLTGQVLLERYGMTEIGMALSNPYRGERRAGCVGQPLPGVQVQLFDDSGQVVSAQGTPGEIRVRGDNVFLEYWNNPAATRESFADGWFRTGDIAVVEDGYYRIMGRSSVDIIKSGGYKLSALEIEGVLLTHPAIAEVAVIGVEDDTWGEAVAAVAVLKPGEALDHPSLKHWCRDRMSAYKVPKTLSVVDALPRNAMGKVTKPTLRALLTAATQSGGSGLD